MTHYHANVTTSGQPDGLFAYEWQARAHLANYYVTLAKMALDGLTKYDQPDGLDIEVAVYHDYLRMAAAIVSTDGTATEQGQEWESEDEWAWFDRCDKAECGSWTWEPSLSLAF